MWPYEEYTLLENMLVLIIPFVVMLIAYFLIMPFLERKMAEKTTISDSNSKEDNDEYW